jgi:hypothetical protein
MAAAHPDRGGSDAAFIEARHRFIEARRRTLSSLMPPERLPLSDGSACRKG